MTIEIICLFGQDWLPAERQFDDLETAVDHALRIANGAGLRPSGRDVPSEVRVIEDDNMILALKVFEGGL